MRQAKPFDLCFADGETEAEFYLPSPMRESQQQYQNEYLSLLPLPWLFIPPRVVLWDRDVHYSPTLSE